MRSVGAQDGQTDRHGKLIVAFRNFGNAPKNELKKKLQKDSYVT